MPDPVSPTLSNPAPNIDATMKGLLDFQTNHETAMMKWQVVMKSADKVWDVINQVIDRTTQ